MFRVRLWLMLAAISAPVLGMAACGGDSSYGIRMDGTLTIKVTRMTSEDCEDSIRQAVAPCPGVKKVFANHMADSVGVVGVGMYPEVVLMTIEKLGFAVQSCTGYQPGFDEPTIGASRE